MLVAYCNWIGNLPCFSVAWYLPRTLKSVYVGQSSKNSKDDFVFDEFEVEEEVEFEVEEVEEERKIELNLAEQLKCHLFQKYLFCQGLKH